MKKVICSILMVIICLFTVTPAVQASADATRFKSENPLSVYLTPGEYTIICVRNDSTEIYDGTLFPGGAQPKRALQKANIRFGPGMQYDIYYSLSAGDIVNAIGIFKGIDCEWNWYLLTDGTFVSSHLLEDVEYDYYFDTNEYDGCIVDTDENISYYDGTLFPDGPKQKQALQKANIRSGPGMQYDILYSLTAGDVVTAVGIFKGVDCDWDWYLLDDGTYVSAHLLKDK